MLRMSVRRLKAQWDLWVTRRRFDKKRRELLKTKPSRELLEEFGADEYYTVRDAGQFLDYVVGSDLVDEARKLDVEVPAVSLADLWVYHEDGEFSWLTPKGRAHVRKLIDEEKTRRFEAKTLWVTRFWLPLLAALVGIVGALTGLIAVLHHR